MGTCQAAEPQEPVEAVEAQQDFEARHDFVYVPPPELVWTAGHVQVAAPPAPIEPVQMRQDFGDWEAQRPLSYVPPPIWEDTTLPLCHRAAFVGDVALVQAELDKGCPVNMIDDSFHACRHQTPLQYAASQGHTDVVKLLLERRADPGAGLGGQAALHLAARRGHGPTIQALLDGGAEINARDSGGQTPLHEAAEWASAETVALLVAARADLTLRDGQGRTTLRLAADSFSEAHPAVVDVLLAAGVDPRITNKNGLTAAEVAVIRMRWSSTRSELARLLQRHEEEWNKPFILQMSSEGVGPEVSLTFHTLAGNVAARLEWRCEDPLHELSQAVLDAIQSSGFTCPFEPMRLSNLRFVTRAGRVLDVGPEAASLSQQLGLDL